MDDKHQEELDIESDSSFIDHDDDDGDDYVDSKVCNRIHELFGLYIIVIIILANGNSLLI